ncbi:MAG: hypothetical protein IJ418_02195 [Clostridia bacterium]|nr:hypothetical protein [Clostridia bacterium]MBQ8616302.1 hypothetical protein [Clostridia bacterium]
MMNNTPYGYQPFPYQQQPMLQRPNMQPQMMQPNQSPWITVPTVEQVEQVSVQPGQEVWIMVQNEPVFARREANRMGLTTTDYCRFEHYDPKAVAAQPAPEYVTREEFDRFVADMKKEWGVNE